MVPDQIWAASPLAPAPKLLLCALWDYAGWSPRGGDAEAFVWPGVAALERKLTCSRATVFRNLATLVREGWISKAWREVTRAKNGLVVRRQGWVLNLAPVHADQRDEAPADEDDSGQRVFGWSDGDRTRERSRDDASGVSRVRLEQSQDRDSKSLNSETRQSHSRDSASSTRLNHQEPPPDPPRARETQRVIVPSATRDRGEGDGVVVDEDRSKARSVFDAYERRRFQTLGGQPIRSASAKAISDIVARVGDAQERYAIERAAAWSMVIEYGNTAIRLVVDARRVDPTAAQQLRAWRQDGREWELVRFESVMARSDSPPPVASDRKLVDGIDPYVDGVEVSGSAEWDAWQAGGDDQVRQVRAARVPGEGTATLEQFTAKLREINRQQRENMRLAIEQTRGETADA